MELQSLDALVFGGFDNLQIATLQDVFKGSLSHFVPLYFNGLSVRNNILLSCIYLFKSVAGTDKHIFKNSNTVLVRYSIFVNGNAAKGCAVKVELHSFHQAILGCFNNLQIAALQFVIEVVFGNFLPFDNRVLAIRNDISFCGIYFFQRIIGADQNILKDRDTVCIGSGIKIDILTGCGFTVKAELHAFIHVILRSFDNLQITSLEDIVKANRNRLSANNRDSLRLLRFIVVDRLLSNGISAGCKVVDDNLAITTGLNCLIYTIAGNRKRNAGDIAVF